MKRHAVGTTLVVLLLILPLLLLPKQSDAQSDLLITARGNFGLEFGQVIDNEGNIRFTDEIARRIAETGATWVHINFRLGGFQDWTETDTFGHSAISLYDEVVATAHRHNLEVVALLSNEAWHGGLVDWSANNAEYAGRDGGNDYLLAFADKVALPLIQHFAGRIQYWEVWNEPNASPTYLYPSNFAWLLARVYTNVKTQGPEGITLISGGLSTVQDRAEKPTTFSTGADYLRETYAAGKQLAGWEEIRAAHGSYPLDAIGQHIYVDGYRPTSRETVREALQMVRDAYVEGENGDGSKLTVITEMGWSTRNISERVQADNLQYALAEIRETPYVQTASWFFLQDENESGLAFGLFRQNDAPKPALHGYRVILYPELPPLQPFGPNASGMPNEIRLEWHPSADPELAGYQIWWSEDPLGPFSLLTPELLAAPSFVDADVRDGKPYYYQITAVDEFGNVSEPSATVGAVAAELLALAPFDETWTRTDRPVVDDLIDRTWMWGDAPFTTVLTERYDDAEAGFRQVQYYDKSRMELTHPEADQDDEWYVTNGLLVWELMSGWMQVGDDLYIEREPAQVTLAGDPGSGPTYAEFSRLRWASAVEEGEIITARVDAEGEVSEDESMEAYEVEAAYFVPETKHTIAEPFWEFMNSKGVIIDEDGQPAEGDLFADPFFATGFPLTEAYWTAVSLAGEPTDVLVQCFQRRCLTYTPDNDEGWRVEAGNVGRHYYEWRYGSNLD